MNRFLKNLAIWLGCVVLLIGIWAIPATAEEIESGEPIETVTVSGVISAYEDVVIKEGNSAKNAAMPLSDITYYDSVQQAAAALRTGMKSRQETVIIGICLEQNDEDLAREVLLEALRHTGDPREGDILRWEFHRWETTIGGHVENGVYYLTLRYDFTYYTTAEQEAAVDAAVAELLEELDLTGCSDYEKIRKIFDWMCSNITYDYDNVNNEAYCLQYTAYAALIDRTAVCQGYANLFYRLCLELGIDCRICYGYGMNIWWGGAEAHTWNLVQLDGKYYYVDTTWGAESVNGKPDYYQLLKGSEGLGNHLLAMDPDFPELDVSGYCTPSEKDFPIPEKTNYIAQGAISNTATFTLSETGVFTVTGTGEICNADHAWYQYLGSTKEVVIGEGITLVGEGLFAAQPQIVSVKLPDTLKVLEDHAFDGVSFVKIHLPAALEQIGTGAISSGVLFELTLDPNNSCFGMLDNNLVSKDGKTLIRCVGEVENGCIVNQHQIPYGIENIAPYAFAYRRTLNRISIPESVKHIGNNAFERCSYALFDIPETIVSIGDYAFYNCNSLHSIRLGKDLTHLGDGVFAAVYSLADVWIHPENPCYASVDSVLFTKDMKTLLYFPPAKECTSYEIPYGVTEIAESAFINTALRASLESITFPDTVKRIGLGAFEGQAKLKSLDLPDSLEIIEDVAFQGLSSLDIIRIPDSIKYIGFGAFNDNGAETIIIGRGVTYLGDAAFTRIDYAHQNGNQEIKVYFLGPPPEEFGFGGNSIFAGYDPEGATPNRVMATVYYPEELAYLWAPNGETAWDPIPDDIVPSGAPAFYHIYPGSPPHNYEAVMTEPTCTQGGYTTYTCTICSDSYEADIVSAKGHAFVDDTCAVCGVNLADFGSGDIDLNDTIDVDDVLALLWHVLFTEEYPIEVEADFDSSGTTDVDDVLVLLWHVLFPEEYPLV